MENSYNYFFFKYLDKSIDIENVIFEEKYVEIIHLFEGYDIMGEYVDYKIPKYIKEIDKLFFDNINCIDTVFDKYSRIDKYPVFRSVLEYDTIGLKSKIRKDKIDKFLKDENGY